MQSMAGYERETSVCQSRESGLARSMNEQEQGSIHILKSSESMTQADLRRLHVGDILAFLIPVTQKDAVSHVLKRAGITCTSLFLHVKCLCSAIKPSNTDFALEKSQNVRQREKAGSFTIAMLLPLKPMPVLCNCHSKAIRLHEVSASLQT